MILSIVLFLSYGMLVSSNNGYPIIPTQTYPIYQQNGYTNPSANQPSEITPYLQSRMVQNQSPPLDLSRSNLRQILLNSILSSQPMQTIFDQNSRGHGWNLVDLPNNAIIPNAVNNYFAAPISNEYVNNQSTGTNKEHKVADNRTKEKRKKHKKRKSSKSRKRQESNKNHDVEVNNKQENDREVSKKSKKRSRKPKIETSSHDTIAKNKEKEVNNPINDESKVENPKPRRRHKKKSKSDKENTEKFNSEQQITPKPKQIQEDNINLVHFTEGIVEENRITRNPILEGNDLYKSIPNLPENIANSFNFKGLPQFNNPAMSNFFANYENIYQSMMANSKSTNDQREVIRRKPKRRNNTKTKIEVKNKISTATEATVKKKPPKPIVSSKINVVTTEKYICMKEKTRTNIDPILKEESSKSTDKPFEVKEAKHEFENEEIKDMESYINDPVLKYGYIDDYYPQFTDSAAYPTTNNREVHIKNLGDTKYYYAIDKGNPEFINRMRFEGFDLPERVTKDYQVNKKYDGVEQEDVRNAFKPDYKDVKEDKVQFRSPPQLEIPDFQTRKIERIEINSQPFYDCDENDDFDARFLGDKSSIYSEAKDAYYAETKGNYKKVQKDKDVETVFARSKVVNYGPVYNREDVSNLAGTSNQALTDDSYSKDGGTTYILATTLDYPERF